MTPVTYTWSNEHVSHDSKTKGRHHGDTYITMVINVKLDLNQDAHERPLQQCPKANVG